MLYLSLLVASSDMDEISIGGRSVAQWRRPIDRSGSVCVSWREGRSKKNKKKSEPNFAHV